VAGRECDPSRTGPDPRLFVEAMLWIARAGWVGPCISVQVRIKDVWDATYGIGVVCSAISVAIYASVNQTKD
jgi:hypothetical protein